MTATFKQPDNTTQDPATYKANIDASVAVHQELAGQFQVVENTSLPMSVWVLPTISGVYYNGDSFIESFARSSGNLVVPTINPYYAVIVIDSVTGNIDVEYGSEVAVPALPADLPIITGGRIPLAVILLTPATTAITNDMIGSVRAVPFNAVMRNGDSNSKFVQGRNATRTSDIINNDWLSEMPSGFYSANNGANTFAAGWVHGIVSRHSVESSNYQFQIAANFHADDFRVRRIVDDVDQGWRTLLHDGNFMSGNKGWWGYKGNVFSNTYVPGAGGNIQLDGVLYDDLLINDAATPGEVVIPVGVERAAMGCVVRCQVSGPVGVFQCNISIELNGVMFAKKVFSSDTLVGYFDLDLDVPPFPVIAGDVVTFSVSHELPSTRVSMSVLQGYSARFDDLDIKPHGTAAYILYYSDPN